MKDLYNNLYKRTQYIALPLYTDLTPVDLRDGYNDAMRILDKKINQLETLIRETKGENQ